jgi:hypothetical protein
MNIQRRMILPLIKVFLLCAFFAGARANATIYLVDQSNLLGGSVSRGTLTPGQSAGQSFTPSLAGIDLFDVQASSTGVSTTEIELFAGQTETGTPIATSETVIINNSTLQMIEFQFPETVSLVPGSIYTARLDLIAGDSYQVAFSAANPYPGGLAFNEFGATAPPVDWVFSEGLAAVPEPSSIALSGLTLVLLFLRRALSSMPNKPTEMNQRRFFQT